MALDALEDLFQNPKVSDTLKGLCAEKLCIGDGEEYAAEIIGKAQSIRGKKANQSFYNLLLAAISKAQSTAVAPFANTLLSATGDNSIVEISYALEMISKNKLTDLSGEVSKLTENKNPGIQRRARETLLALGK
jgi:hypothetical protein